MLKTLLKEHLAEIENIWGKQGEQCYLSETSVDAFVDNLLQ